MTCPKCGKSSPADWILCEECTPDSNSRPQKTAQQRRITLDLKRRKPKRDYIKLTILSIAMLMLLTVIAYFQLEIYTIPPIDPMPDGATLIVWRAGDISEPFFNSPDAAMNSANPNAVDFAALIPTNRTILKLPYVEYFYLKSPIVETQEN